MNRLSYRGSNQITINFLDTFVDSYTVYETIRLW